MPPRKKADKKSDAEKKLVDCHVRLMKTIVCVRLNTVGNVFGIMIASLLAQNEPPRDRTMIT